MIRKHFFGNRLSSIWQTTTLFPTVIYDLKNLIYPWTHLHFPHPPFWLLGLCISRSLVNEIEGLFVGKGLVDDGKCLSNMNATIAKWNPVFEDNDKDHGGVWAAVWLDNSQTCSQYASHPLILTTLPVGFPSLTIQLEWSDLIRLHKFLINGLYNGDKIKQRDLGDRR